jgi:outer membrane protein TolC
LKALKNAPPHAQRKHVGQVQVLEQRVATLQQQYDNTIAQFSAGARQVGDRVRAEIQTRDEALKQAGQQLTYVVGRTVNEHIVLFTCLLMC